MIESGATGLHGAVEFLVGINEKVSFGGKNGKKYIFWNIGGKGFDISSKGEKIFSFLFSEMLSDYLIDDRLTYGVVCDWRLQQLEDGVAKIYTKEGYRTT